jgi:hypothetical protein
MIRSMESFTFASELYLNMGTIYYHIKLDADDQRLSTIVLVPWYSFYRMSSRYSDVSMWRKIWIRDVEEILIMLERYYPEK